MRKTWLLLGAVGFGVLFACSSPPAKPPVTPPVAVGDGGVAEDVAQRKILHRKDLTDLPDKEMIAVAVTIPPHSSLGKATHAGQGFGYVISGAIQMTFEGEEPRMVNAGETVATKPDKQNEVKNLGSEPAKLITIMIVKKGGTVNQVPGK